MKYIVLALALAVVPVSGQTSKAKSAKKASTNTPAEVTIPKGAVEQADGNFHYTDSQGKKWLYRKTPFGISKVEDKGDTVPVATNMGPDGKTYVYQKTPFGVSKVEEKATAAPATPQLQDTVTIATDKGDSVHFEKPSPFGTVKWDKKKNELDANEQSIWNRQKKQ